MNRLDLQAQPMGAKSSIASRFSSCLSKCIKFVQFTSPAIALVGCTDIIMNHQRDQLERNYQKGLIGQEEYTMRRDTLDAKIAQLEREMDAVMGRPGRAYQEHIAAGGNISNYNGAQGWRQTTPYYSSMPASSGGYKAPPYPHYVTVGKPAKTIPVKTYGPDMEKFAYVPGHNELVPRPQDPEAVDRSIQSTLSFMGSSAQMARGRGNPADYAQDGLNAFRDTNAIGALPRAPAGPKPAPLPVTATGAPITADSFVK